MMDESTYNTYLVKLWLDNDRENYYACGDITARELHDTQALLDWLKERNYGGDKEKIVLDTDMLDLSSIRNTIKDNMNAINA